MRLVTVSLGTAAAVAICIAALFIGEALWLGVFASEAQVAEYRFGSEPMVGYGGSAYESLTSYVVSGLFRGMVLLALAFAFSFGAVRSWRRPNKPLQPTRAAGANGQREPAGTGPRG
jgi:hypothetical protein